MLNNTFKFNYSVGAIANGIKTDTFTFFLLFFYSRVIGLDPLLASLAIGLALIIDSFTDPLMGTVSDRTNSKYGRRHPFMYISFIPVSIFYVLLFTPKPDWDLSQIQLFWWMFVCASFTRIGMTFFEVPHRSLGSEMSRSYTERTSIFATRELLGWMGGLFNAFLAYTIFFKDTPDYMPGTKNPEPWIYYGMTGATIMCFSVLVTYFGTLKYRDNSQIDITTFNLRLIFNQIFIALKNRSFLIFFFGSFKCFVLFPIFLPFIFYKFKVISFHKNIYF